MKLDIKPLSLNQLYPSNRNGRRFLSKDGAIYKATIQNAVKSNLKLFPEKGYSLPLEFNLIVSGPYLTKQGAISKTAGDVDNAIKGILDAVCDELDINDACVFRVSAEKKIAQEWSIEFYLCPILPVIH
jgi:Holliday junction resolvase RusA-like endonuclease